MSGPRAGAAPADCDGAARRPGAAASAVALPSGAELFPDLGKVAFLNHAAASPAPRPVREAIAAMADRIGRYPYPDALAIADALRPKVGRLVNCEPTAVAFTRSTSHALTIVASGLDWRRGDNVVAIDGDYPSVVYPWMALARRGVELRFVAPRGGRVAVEDVADRIDGRTRVVVLSHVQFRTGFRLPLREIGALCREREVLFCVDGMQSVGVVPLDVQEMHVDVLACGSAKWLMGLSGSAFLYIRPDLLPEIPPLIPGALSVADRADFTEYSRDWAPDAHRFEESWLSLPNLAGLDAAVELACRAPIEAVERRVQSLIGRLTAGVASLDVEIGEPWPRAAGETSGIVTLRHRRHEAGVVMAALARRSVAAVVRGGAVRISPHYHNADEHIDRVLDVLDSLP